MARMTESQAKAAQEALDAVDQALQIDFGQEAEADSLEPAEKPIAPPAKPATIVAPPTQPDNDATRSGVARFRASLVRKPSRAPLFTGLFLSVAWIALACFAGYGLIGDSLFSQSAWMNIGNRPDLLYFAASVILPLFLIWAYVVMMRRASELKTAAASMTEAAYRLIEPESEAVSSVRNVSHAIRSEVNALSDGIDRAMSRATELETLVHNEVSSLEASYAENEGRIRALVDELAREREEIVSHSERVRSSITGASETLREDLSLSARQISDNVSDAQKDFAASLGDTNAKMRESLAASGEALLQSLDATGVALGERLDTSGSSLGRTFTTHWQRNRQQCGRSAGFAWPRRRNHHVQPVLSDGRYGHAD